ncbi:protein mono-ADP-ribosyltransferase TIPARP [Ambystoma mexicanum]|uniref:protein mono-ADP-ribosyltransferase TIPARP n=1 Tax=Ambystoma mexicanum TaxID=8296 RepID=UPI0037E8EB49
MNDMAESVYLKESEPAAPCVASPPCPGMKCSEVAEGVFPAPRRLTEKIPPVKPCFKKKQAHARLDKDRLRAFGPFFTSLLGASGLDGVFLPRSQSANSTNLCESAVKKGSPCPQASALISGPPSLGPLADPLSPVLQENSGGQCSLIEVTDATFQTDAPDVTVANAPVAQFQDPHLHTGPTGGTTSVCPEKTLESYTSGPFQTISCPGPSVVSQSSSVNPGLFQGQTEEASLLLLFELLNQLQYHIHQDDGIEICVAFLEGTCFHGRDCPRHHTVLPYHWQIRRRINSVWQSVSDDSQEHLERLYCNPESNRIKLKYQGHELLADLNVMTVYDSVEFDQIRRLATPSCTSTPYHTVWKYFCRDHFGWREYSEPVVRLIEEANCRGLNEVRFVTWHNQYILNIKDGFQQNACFRREIKRRPLFRSSVMLTPHLQTLGALPPLTPSAMEVTPAQAIAPTAVASPNVYPETWIPMDPCQDFLQVPVPKEDKSFRTVYNLFHKTIPETKFRILKILRVQNLFLWEKYKRKKEYMSRKMTGLVRMQNERHLFHGTSQDAVDSICKHNFDPRVCGKHATMLGQGSYFARKATYSHNFSKRSPKGVHYMFLAKVLTGRYTVGNHTMRRPPPLNPGIITSDLYDSCVDNFFEPQIFVIFNDDQTFPYFVIQYEEVGNTVSI